MDFITKLPLSNSYINLIVITYRLSKGVILKELKEIIIKVIVKRFI